MTTYYRRWLSHANAPVYGMFVYCAPTRLPP